MSARRAARIASVIQEEVARILRVEAKDPRITPLTVTNVAVNDDLSVARICYMPLGGRGDRDAMQAALDELAPRIRGPVGRALGIRHAPELRFEFDRNIDYAAHMEEVFRNLPRPAEEA